MSFQEELRMEVPEAVWLQARKLWVIPSRAKICLGKKKDVN